MDYETIRRIHFLYHYLNALDDSAPTVSIAAVMEGCKQELQALYDTANAARDARHDVSFEQQEARARRIAVTGR